MSTYIVWITVLTDIRISLIISILSTDNSFFSPFAFLFAFASFLLIYFVLFVLKTFLFESRVYGESKVNDFIQNCISFHPSPSNMYCCTHIYLSVSRTKKKIERKKVEVDDVGVVSVIHFFLLSFFLVLFSLRYFFINLMVVDVEL